MNNLSWSEFRVLPVHNKFLLTGHTFIVVGGSCLAFGSLLEMLKEGGLPTKPVTTTNFTSGNESNSLYSARKSYFES
jgi:hypothetical protein